MWTIERVIDTFNRLCENDNLPAPAIPITVNGRLSRCLGRVFFTSGSCKPTRIEFARILLNETDDETIEQVIKHEYVHYYLLITTHEDHGHDILFKKKCAEIGCYHDKAQNEVAAFTAKSTKYEVFCMTCNKRVGQYSRMCKTLKNLDSCMCNICKTSNLKMIQNW